ncbi:uncharacterized protein LOC114754652 [Neltuma alba]|uniref:uncharacterized protein LOC114754652 n=1 Tax=Neltuma alba TaxID=207710 RepID=UPI0010A386B4|nr:uncharacterized protein LOC114754652 [Prosopis alba]
MALHEKPIFYDDTSYSWSKVSRCFLPQNHPWRKDAKSFDGKEELRAPPIPLTGDDALMQLEQLERNVSDNLVSTVMDLLGKTKDTLKSRYDLVDLGIRSNLHPIKNGNDVYKPPAPYTLSSEKKQSLCKFLANLKVPDAFASNISRKYFQLQYVGYCLPKYLRTLKSYVGNKAQPEGSIAEGYLADESLTFCSRYLKDIPTKFNVQHRNDDISDNNISNELSVFKKSGEAKGHFESVSLSYEEYCQARMEQRRELEARGLMSEQNQYKEFPDWFRSRVIALSTQGFVSPELKSLSIGPSRVVNRYSMFIGNGFRFHAKDRAIGKRTQNDGVMAKGDDTDANKEYYGVLEHIYELSYIENKKLYLFKCHWWDVANYGEGYKVDKYGFTSINTQCSLQTNEPFILASQAEQVFYVDDIVDPGWIVVVKTNPRDLFNMPIENVNVGSDVNIAMVDEEPYQQLVVDLNASLIQHDIFIDLCGDDVQPQTFIQVGEPSQRSNMEIGFIDDSESNSLVHDDSDEEDVLDGNDSDTEEESDIEGEIEDDDTSDSTTEDSTE